ncbi:AHH domain-containing protein [Microcoleus sp. herbarium14]|uniref:AHH domain-containing protein n=1 Tax=Microcoleus sp. herbarium14 TaxID=3055439 RepID=UPI002FD664A9
MTKFQRRLRIPADSPQAKKLGICGDCLVEWNGQDLSITSNLGKSVSFTLDGFEILALLAGGDALRFITENLGNPKRFERGIDVPGTSSKYTGTKGEYRAHHVIPKSLNNHGLLTQAGYDINDQQNEIYLPKDADSAALIYQETGQRLPIHSGGHQGYIDGVIKILNQELYRLPIGKSNDKNYILDRIDAIIYRLKAKIVSSGKHSMNDFREDEF